MRTSFLQAYLGVYMRAKRQIWGENKIKWKGSDWDKRKQNTNADKRKPKTIVSSYTTSKIGALIMARASNWFIDASFEKEWKVKESICSKIKIRTYALLYKSFVMDFEVTGGKVTVVRAPKQPQVTHDLW